MSGQGRHPDYGEAGEGEPMEQLLKRWRDASYWTSLAGQRFTEYLLIAAYSAVALLSLIVGLTARTGTLFGRAVENSGSAARPELKVMMKQLAVAGADLSSGASLLVIAAVIVYWGRRTRKEPPENLPVSISSGPPFML
jgi:hypothetical protein